MSKSLKNTGIFLLNNEFAYEADHATYIVIGVPRSGTSMVAKSLTKFGVFMGQSLDEAVFEDVEIAMALEEDPKLLAGVIKSRNTVHKVWGFKRPTAYRHLSTHLKKFRNPRLIVTFRDPVAIAKRNSISVFSEFTSALATANLETTKLIDFVSKLKTPAMLISYEKAMSNKKLFANELAGFCSFNGSENKLDEVVKSMVNGPVKYLESSRIKLEGRIDSIKDGVVSGWARQIGGKSPLKIRIVSGGKTLGEGSANLFRNDLKLANKADGNCAFNIKVSPIMPGSTVTAVVDQFNQVISERKA